MEPTGTQLLIFKPLYESQRQTCLNLDPCLMRPHRSAHEKYITASQAVGCGLPVFDVSSVHPHRLKEVGNTVVPEGMAAGQKEVGGAAAAEGQVISLPVFSLLSDDLEGPVKLAVKRVRSKRVVTSLGEMLQAYRAVQVQLCEAQTLAASVEQQYGQPQQAEQHGELQWQQQQSGEQQWQQQQYQ